MNSDTYALSFAKTLRATELHFLTTLQACPQGVDLKADPDFGEGQERGPSHCHQDAVSNGPVWGSCRSILRGHFVWQDILARSSAYGSAIGVYPLRSALPPKENRNDGIESRLFNALPGQFAISKSTCPVSGASSTGRCNTIQSVDPTILPP